MPNDIDKDAIYGDPEPLSARPPKPKPEKRNIPLSTSKISLENYKPSIEKWPAPEGWDPDKPKTHIEPANLAPKDPVDYENLPLRIKRELMELEPYLKRFNGDQTRAKLQLELDKQEAKTKHFTPDDLEEIDGIELVKIRPKKTGRRPKQLEKRPKKGGQRWGSKCEKHEFGFDMENCMVCEYRAACCKGYPVAFVPLPKILEHVIPQMEPATFKVYWALLQTVRTFNPVKQNFAISWATNKQISKLSGIKEKNLYIHYRRLERDYGLIRKQTDQSRNKDGSWRRRRNFFDLSPVYSNWFKIKELEQSLKGKSATNKYRMRRADVTLSRRAANREISRKTQESHKKFLSKEY